MSPAAGSLTSPYILAPVTTVPEALARMHQIQEYIESHEPNGVADGVARFNSLYTVITTRVLEWINAGRFANGRFLEELDVAFANRYLKALERSAAVLSSVPKPWRVLIRKRSDDRVAALQFAVAGVNAHINFDLPSAVVDACLKLGGRPDSGTRPADYRKVNEIFAVEMEGLRHRFEDQMIQVLDQQALAQVLNIVGNWSVEEARDVAWTNARLLYQWRNQHFFRDPYLLGMEESAGFAGNLLLTNTL